MPSRKPWYRRWWHVCVKALRGVIRLEDTPYRIAMGCACGLFSCVLPIFGQTVVGMVLAKLFRANVVAAMPWSWLSNPATTLPIWYGCYRVGAALLREEAVTVATLRGIASRLDQDGLAMTLSAGGKLIGEVVVPLLLGTVMVGVILGALGYLAIKPLVVRIQARRAAKAARWSATVACPAAGRPAPDTRATTT